MSTKETRVAVSSTPWALEDATWRTTGQLVCEALERLFRAEGLRAGRSVPVNVAWNAFIPTPCTENGAGQIRERDGLYNLVPPLLQVSTVSATRPFAVLLTPLSGSPLKVTVERRSTGRGNQHEPVHWECYQVCPYDGPSITERITAEALMLYAAEALLKFERDGKTVNAWTVNAISARHNPDADGEVGEASWTLELTAKGIPYNPEKRLQARLRTLKPSLGHVSVRVRVTAT